MSDRDADAEPLAFEPGELPDLMEDNRLVLMAVDPYLVYDYWNVSAKRVEAASALFDQGDIEGHVLRFHDTTGIEFDGVNSRGSFDVRIQIEARRWYVRLWSPDKRYCADIGLRGKDGRLVALLRSNMVETPPDWPRVRFDESALVVEQEGAAEGAPPPSPPPAERDDSPMGSQEVLERRVADIAALRDEPLLSDSDGNGDAPLTEMSERNFEPGISSVLVGKRGSGQ